MSNQLETKCPICGGYMFDDDDIVYCPVCGAPHHRDCYNAVGHCGKEELHGTPEQYTKPDNSTQDNIKEEQDDSICPMCGKQIPSETKFCPFCGAPKGIKINMGGFGNMPTSMLRFKIDPLGGVDKNAEICGVKAGKLATFINFAPNKILPKFMTFCRGAKSSWNWIGFISPYSHTLFRKMYGPTFLYIITELISLVLLTPAYYSISSISMPVGATSTDLVNLIMANPVKYINQTSIILGLIGAVLFLAMRIFAGLKNDYLYMKHCTASIKEIESNSALDSEEEFYKKGGTRPFLSLALFTFSVYFGGVILELISGLFFK